MTRPAPAPARSNRWLHTLGLLAAALTLLLLLVAFKYLAQNEHNERERTLTLARTLSYAISGLVRETPDEEGRLSAILDEVAGDEAVRGIGIIDRNGVPLLARGHTPLPHLPPLADGEQFYRHDGLFVAVHPFAIQRGCSSGAEQHCACGSPTDCQCDAHAHDQWVIGPGQYGLAMLLTPSAAQSARRAVWMAAGSALLIIVGFAVALLLLRRSIGINTQLTAEIARTEQRHSALASQALAAAGMAHEVRNPLSAISGHTQLLAETAPSPEARQRAALVLQELSRVQDRLEEFLSFSARRTLDKTAVHLHALAQDAIDLLRADADRRGTTLVLDSANADAIAMADAYQLKELVLNLLLNAIAATDAPGHIRVRIDDAGHAPTLTICDDGPGIPAAQLSRVFEPYFTTRKGGTGLGLAIARRIALDHGATLTLENRPGGGLKASLAFPPRQV